MLATILLGGRARQVPFYLERAVRDGQVLADAPRFRQKSEKVNWPQCSGGLSHTPVLFVQSYSWHIADDREKNEAWFRGRIPLRCLPIFAASSMNEIGSGKWKP